MYTIAGATGFIGRALVHTLQARNAQLQIADRNEAFASSNNFGHLIYAIGLTADFRSRPFETMRAHVSKINDILEKTTFDSFLLMSSTRIYGKSSDGKEITPLVVDAADPSDLYNISKLAGESICLNSGRKNVRVARLSNVIDPDFSSGNFVDQLLTEARTGRLVLRSKSDSSKDYIHLSDAIRALLWIVEFGASSSIYNVASGFNIKTSEIIAVLAGHYKFDVETIEEAETQEFPKISIGKLNAIGYHSSTNVLEQLGEFVSSYSNRKNHA